MNDDYGRPGFGEDGWDPTTWERMREVARQEAERVSVGPRVLPIDHVSEHETVTQVPFYDVDSGRVAQDYTIPVIELASVFRLSDEQVYGPDAERYAETAVRRAAQELAHAENLVIFQGEGAVRTDDEGEPGKPKPRVGPANMPHRADSFRADVPWIGLRHDWHSIEYERLRVDLRRAQDELVTLVDPAECFSIPKRQDAYFGLEDRCRGNVDQVAELHENATAQQETADFLKKIDDHPKAAILQAAIDYLSKLIGQCKPGTDDVIVKLRDSWPKNVRVRNGTGFAGLMQYARDFTSIEVEPKADENGDKEAYHLNLIRAVNKAISLLQAEGAYGPYGVVLSPPLYADAHSSIPGTRIRPIEQIPQDVEHFESTRALGEREGIVVSLGAEMVDLVRGGDGYAISARSRGHTNRFRTTAKLALRVKRERVAVALDFKPLGA